MPALIDITGKRFSRLTVVRRSPKNAKHGPFWDCICDCGNTAVVSGGHLRNGHTNSCGCFSRDRSASINRAHGHTVNGATSAEYRCWQNMRKRCSDIANKCYHIYGARGIVVCERWRNSFENFLADMGPKPSPAHSIERLNSDGHYEPGNCVWATAKRQANNTSRNHWVTIGGSRKTLTEWCEDLGVSYTATKQRINKLGWPAELALTMPPGTKSKDVLSRGQM